MMMEQGTHQDQANQLSSLRGGAEEADGPEAPAGLGVAAPPVLPTLHPPILIQLPF